MEADTIKHNNVIKVGGVSLGVLLTEKEIISGTQSLAYKIHSNHYRDKEKPILLVVVNGGIFFASDLVRDLQDFGSSLLVETIRVSRYSGDGATNKKTDIQKPNRSFKDKKVIVVDDIKDNGATFEIIYDYLIAEGALSIEFCVLIEKQNDKKFNFDVKYALLREVNKDLWLVGNGMDSDFCLRGLRDICYKI